MSDPDLLKKLELMANLKAGDMVPPEIAPNPWDWAEPVTKLFADALEEIRRLYADVDALTTNPVFVVVHSALEQKRLKLATESVEPPDVDGEPVDVRDLVWASPYVMDPKNWK